MKDRFVFRDTIFALSSGALPSGVAIVRVSGAGTRALLEAAAGCVPEPRMARLLKLTNRNGAEIDRGLVLFFPGPHSFTGEDCAEFHLHGGRAVIAALMEMLTAEPMVRAAEAGEFTRRALINGKIDLAGAEALADLIDAETEAQRRFAVENGAGKQRALYESWRARLIGLQARIEAQLDFSDQEDVPKEFAPEILEEAGRLRAELLSHASGYSRAEIIKQGFRVVLLGAPNAGKSSLLNALACREVAIVTEEEGTTRDVIEVTLDVDGMKIVVSDTAGLRSNPGAVEAIGIERALDRARDAQLVLFLEDMTRSGGAEPPEDLSVIRIGTKRDKTKPGREGFDLTVSALTGEGLDDLLSMIGARATAGAGSEAEILPFRRRHVDLMREAGEHLAAAQKTDGQLELLAEELRLASGALGRITGSIEPEDVLDAIFSTFCIGK